MDPQKSGQLRQARELELTLERLLSDARAGRLKGAVLACKYSVWHHGVWIVGDYVERPEEALEATGKILDSLREYSSRQAEPVEQEPLSSSIGMLYRLIAMPDGRATMPYCTDAVRRIFRLSPEDVKHNALLVEQHIHPEDLARMRHYFCTTMKNGGFWNQQYRVRFPDGTGHDVSSTAEVVRLPDGSYQFDGVIVERDPQRLRAIR